MVDTNFLRWKGNKPPKKILAMRFQALGDTIITLPYLQDLKRKFPEIKLHLLTRKEVCPVPENIKLFDKVITFGGGRNGKLQILFSFLKLPYLWLQGYDLVLDLQKNVISVNIRKLLFPKAWTEFDKYSANSAAERTRKTIEAVWDWNINLDPQFIINNTDHVPELLKKNGHRADHELIVLNPAGYSPSRSWPSENYISFAKLWLQKINPKAQFVLLLIPSLSEKANVIAKGLGDHCINLTGRSNQLEAFAIIQRSRFMLSEDSGLMHMAWVQKIPTLALFSSNKKIWSAPQGEWSYCFDSSDLECGPCMLEVCKFGDNRCLTRYSPEQIINKAMELISSPKQ